MTKTDGEFGWKESVSLKEHLTEQIESLRREMTSAIQHQKETTHKAEGAQQTYNALHNDLIRKIDNMKETFVTTKQLDELRNRVESDTRSNISLVFAFLALMVAVIKVFVG